MNDPSAVFSGPAVTALGLAASRTVESSRPDRLIRDPLARAFFEAAGMNLPMRLDWPEPGEPVTDAERLHLHGSRYIGMRTRHYDDLLLRAAEAGLRQAVLIGAGLDTRAFRLPLPADVHLIELDQAALLQWKQTVLDAHTAIPSCRRSCIGVDLRDDWRAALADRGFDAAEPTALIAEGLLPYLTPQERPSFLAQIDAAATTGTVLALDRIVGDPHAAGRVASLSHRSGLDMTQLLAGGENDDTAATLRAAGWRAHEISVSDLATSYARDLSDPFAATESSSAREPPWLETRFLEGTR